MPAVHRRVTAEVVRSHPVGAVRQIEEALTRLSCQQLRLTWSLQAMGIIPPLINQHPNLIKNSSPLPRSATRPVQHQTIGNQTGQNIQATALVMATTW